jgi:CBS domain containing-hemolysin-like protein
MASMQASHLKPSFAMTEDDLRIWVEEDQSNGSLEKGERKMIYSIFQFGETLAREIMVPRIDVVALDIDTPLEEAVQALSKSGHSRLPVYEETIDNIIGLLYAKDLLALRRSKDSPLRAMKDMLRPAYFVPEAKKVDELLAEMQSNRIHMAVVVDEYGGVAGLVTLEDIMEEIIGEVQDEYDQAEEMLYQQVTPDEYVFQGRIDLGDFNEIMGSNLSKETADTLAGFIYGEIGRVPAGGETVAVDGLNLTVEQVTGRRIRKVRACRSQPANEVEGGSNNADR